MAFAKFNQCNPCCNCSFDISYSNTPSGPQIPGVTITVRDVRGSGVGSCVTTISGCTIPIKSPGTYYAHNDFCNTTQKLTIAKCGSDVNVVISTANVLAIAESECSNDAPLTRFTFSGPGGSYTTEASGNTLVGPLPFPHLAAQAGMPTPIPSGDYTITVEDVEGNHYPATVQANVPCGGLVIPRIPMIKKWGYTRVPNYITAAGCPAAGITISDDDGHSATTDGDGRICQVWKYEFPDEFPTTEDDVYTRIHVTKSPFIDPCGEEGCQWPKPRCMPELLCDSGDFTGFSSYNVLMPPGYWGAPTDDCVEPIPQTLTLTTKGFHMTYSMCRIIDEPPLPPYVEAIPDSTFTTTSVSMLRGGPGVSVSWPFNYVYPGYYGVNVSGVYSTEPFVCGRPASVGVWPSCKKDVNNGGGLGMFVSISNDGPYGFPMPPWTYLGYIGTTACPTMITAIEYGSYDDKPTGRSITISS